MKLSLVVPCYNEEFNVKDFHNAVEKTFEKEKFNYEIVFINDGSTDGTLRELKDICNYSKQNIKIVNFSRNFGKEAGMYAGLQNASGEYVSIIDADLQQRPEYVLEMVNYLENHEDVDSVVAYQEKRKEGAILSFFKHSFYRIINKASDVEFVNGASDFRTLRRSVVNAILELKEYYRFSKGIFSWVGFNNYYMPYEVEERAKGYSKWSFKKLWKYAMGGIVAFTTAPLKLATFLGIGLSFCAFIYFIVVLIQKLFFSIAVPGYATIVMLILLIGGIELFCIGLIGEYLARTYVEVKNRPIYIAKEIIDNKDKKND